MNETANAFRAGLVVIAAVAIGMYFFVSSRKSTLNDLNSTPYYALLTDSSGLSAKSLISVAGLQVGEIKNISLVDSTVGELSPDRDALAKDVRPEFAELNDEGTLDRWVVGENTLVKKGETVAFVRVEKRGKEPQEIAVKSPKEGILYGIVVEPGTPVTGAWTLARVSENPEKRVRVARVDFVITNEVKLPDDTWAKKESLGLLGAKALFLELGESQTFIEPKGRIKNVRSLTGLDVILNRLEGIADEVESIVSSVEKNIGGITADIKGVTGVLNRFIQGDEDTMPIDELYELVMNEIKKTIVTVEKAVRDVDRIVVKNDEQVTTLLANLEDISADVKEMTAGGDGGTGGDIRESVGKIRKITDDLSVVTTSLKDVIGENEGEIGDQVKQLKVTMTELNTSLGNLSEITGRIERGEGTVGRLLTDENMANKLEDAVTGATDYISGLTSLEAHIDLGTWYSVRRGSANVALGVKIQPKPDKFYFIEVVDDGGGVERVTRVIDSFQPVPAGTAFVRREQVMTDDNSLRFTANFAKRFFDFLVLRAGIIETSGGVGADLYFWEDRIQLRNDFFNFGGPRNSIDSMDPMYAGHLTLPRWRMMLKVQPIPHVYIMGGFDDILNAVDYGAALDPNNPQLVLRNPRFHGYGTDFMIGVGITFRDDDLRTILPFLPSL
jgi:phospholipid/cholesterol/gamma-HCH transport system substrate-binding protein